MVQKIRKDTHGHTATTTTPPHGLPTAVMPVRWHRQNQYFVYQTTRSCKRLLNTRPGLVGDVYTALHRSETCGISGNMRTKSRLHPPVRVRAAERARIGEFLEGV